MTPGPEILEALPVAVYITDAEGRITFYNQAAADLWGHRPKLGTDFWCGSWRLYWPDGAPMAHHECPMATAIKEGRPIRDIEAVLERPDGARVPFRPYPTPLKDESGRVIGAINLLIDATDLKQAEIESARLAAIVVSSDDAIVGKTLDGCVTSWNAGATRIFGYEPKEMIGQSIIKITPPSCARKRMKS
jgi:PAS domain S-box-containing protein